jgi:hypothetical protein
MVSKALDMTAAPPQAGPVAIARASIANTGRGSEVAFSGRGKPDLRVDDYRGAAFTAPLQRRQQPRLPGSDDLGVQMKNPPWEAVRLNVEEAEVRYCSDADAVHVG